MSHRILVLLLGGALLLTTMAVAAEAATWEPDVTALKELYNSVDPSSIREGSCLSSWDFRHDPCDSAFTTAFTCGIRCSSGNNRRVIELTLDSSAYNGTVPASVGFLTALTDLDLSGNAFHGAIPSSIANLTALQHLALSANTFSGPLPPQMGDLASLQRLSLDGNAFSGALPPELSALTALTHLDISGNRFTGALPALARMPALEFVDATGNRLTGFTGALSPTLVELSLRQNHFPTLPELHKLSKLQVLDMSENVVSGAVPSSVFEHPALEQLTLAHNDLTVINVPGSYGRRSSLVAVDLSANRIRGPLPAFMASIPTLTSLSLSDNMFSGFIPYTYARPGKRPLARLLLSGNYLFGDIPLPFRSSSSSSSSSSSWASAGVVNVSFADNCLLDCPQSLPVCRGPQQKTLDTCRSFTSSSSAPP